MKKIMSLVFMLGVLSLIVLTGCSTKQEVASTAQIEEQVQKDQEKEEIDQPKEEKILKEEQAEVEEKKISKPINIATLNGPTGIGMVKLMEENSEEFLITAYQSPDEIVGKVVSGEVDIACVPSNLAAVLYNKTQGGIKLLGTNTLGVLYMVEKGETIKSIEDLKGKIIIASGKGSTPEFILNNILMANGIDPEKDVTVEYMANHSDVISALLADDTDKIAILPEPHVTTAMSKDEKVRVAIDLNEEWKKVEKVDLPMGVIIVSKQFAENNKEDLNIFVEKYKKSVEFVNEQVEEAAQLAAKHKIVPNEEIALKAIPKCNIIFRGSMTSKESIEKFYQIISEVEPKSVGGQLPDEAFYLAE